MLLQPPCNSLHHLDRLLIWHPMPRIQHLRLFELRQQSRLYTRHHALRPTNNIILGANIQHGDLHFFHARRQLLIALILNARPRGQVPANWGFEAVAGKAVNECLFKRRVLGIRAKVDLRASIDEVLERLFF